MLDGPSGVHTVIRNLGFSKLFWGIPTTSAFFAALGGILFKDIYVNLFPTEFLPGALPQDVLTILICLSLFVLIRSTRQGDVKKEVVIIGLLGSLFYLYGIFTMERVYNGFYLLYMLTFASSFWSIVYSMAGFKPETLPDIRIGDRMLRIMTIACFVIAVVFAVLWTAALLPLMREHNRIEFLYSIYVLDLCFIMPAFCICAVMILRRMPLGILMAPALMILGFFVIFPLGMNELAKPSVGLPINFGALATSFLFAGFMLVVAVSYLRRMKIVRARG